MRSYQILALFKTLKKSGRKNGEEYIQFHFLVIKHYMLLKNAIFNQIPSTGKLIYIF